MTTNEQSDNLIKYQNEVREILKSKCQVTAIRFSDDGWTAYFEKNGYYRLFFDDGVELHKMGVNAQYIPVYVPLGWSDNYIQGMVDIINNPVN